MIYDVTHQNIPKIPIWIMWFVNLLFAMSIVTLVKMLKLFTERSHEIYTCFSDTSHVCFIHMYSFRTTNAPSHICHMITYYSQSHMEKHMITCVEMYVIFPFGKAHTENTAIVYKAQWRFCIFLQPVLKIFWKPHDISASYTVIHLSSHYL